VPHLRDSLIVAKVGIRATREPESLKFTHAPRVKAIPNEADDHFVTFSCFRREPYLSTPSARDLVEQSIESTRKKYNFNLLGYVIMPEHIHLLLSEPETKPLATAIQSLKLSISKQSSQRPFWATRYYDFNVFTHNKRVEKLKYMHRNPITRGLVTNPEDWRWSSYHHYAYNEPTKVQITNP
jgi:putative transposase